MTLYLYITNDKYELPIAVADSPAELGRMIGRDGRTISRVICQAKKRGSRSRYLKIEVGNDHGGLNMQEEYKRNADFRSYVDRFCSQYRKTVDEALLDLVVQEVVAQYREERYENKNKSDAR